MATWWLTDEWEGGLYSADTLHKEERVDLCPVQEQGRHEISLDFLQENAA